MRISFWRFPDKRSSGEKKDLARRIIPGILAIAAGIALIIAIDTASMEMLPRMIVAGVFAALLFGGIGCFLGMAWTAVYGVWLALMIGLPRLLPQPWGGLSLIVLLSTMAVLPRLFSKPKQADEESDPEEEGENSPFPELFAEWNDFRYQLMRGDECIYVISLGDDLIRKPERAIASPDEFTPGRGRRIIEFGDIDTVHISIKEKGAHIRLKTWTKTFRWDVLDYSLDTILSLFDGLPVTCENKVKRLAKAQRIKIESLSSMCRVLRIASWIAGLLFLFVGQPYRTLAIVNLAIPVIFLVIYARNLSDWYLFEVEKRWRMTSGCWVLSSLALSMRAMIDFNMPQIGQLVKPALIIAAAGILLFLLLSIGHKKKWSHMLCILLCTVLYASTGVVMINYLLPIKTSEAYVSVVLEKDIHSGRRTPDFYEITLSNQLGRFEVDTSREIYNQLAVGGEAVYLLETSVLGIESTDVYPTSILE